MVTIGFRPARRERLADILYEQILEQITVGIFGEGDRLPSENEICRAFEVSRPVVREALMRLQADGVLISRQGVGTFVKRRPEPPAEGEVGEEEPEDPMEAFELLAAIEVEAAQLGARRRTPQQLKDLLDVVETLASSTNELAVRRTEIAFYHGIVATTGNRRFVQHLDTLLSDHDGLASRQFAVRLSGAEKVHAVEEYRQIVEAIKIGDAQLAGLMMAYHMARTRARLAPDA